MYPTPQSVSIAPISTAGGARGGRVWAGRA
jgi:hypothetical protein